MKKHILTLAAIFLALVSCSKGYINYPDGYDRIYYAYFDYEFASDGTPNLANTTIELDKSTETLTPVSVRFSSEIERDFDVEVRLYVRNSPSFLKDIKVKKNDGMYSTADSLAVPGLDFAVLDENHEVLTPVRADSLMYYSLVYRNARRDKKTLYIKTLDNQDYSCQRQAWLSLSLNNAAYTDENDIRTNLINHRETRYEVHTLTKSWLRSITIK